MKSNLVARASIDINAPVDKVWDALVNPASIKAYMFGASVVSDWKPGSAITWKGEWQGRAYEDKGRIIAVERNRRLQYTHFSPLTGQPDTPENYHTVTFELAGSEKGTHVSLSQDNNANEQERDHSQKNWEMMLQGLKQFVEQGG